MRSRVVGIGRVWTVVIARMHQFRILVYSDRPARSCQGVAGCFSQQWKTRTGVDDWVHLHAGLPTARPVVFALLPLYGMAISYVLIVSGLAVLITFGTLTAYDLAQGDFVSKRIPPRSSRPEPARRGAQTASDRHTDEANRRV